MKYKMLIKMDSEIFLAASLLWVDLIVFHQNIWHPEASFYKIINGNWQKYEQGIMPQHQLVSRYGCLIYCS
jgi:hypothetical protein